MKQASAPQTGITEPFSWLPVPGNQEAVITPALGMLVKKLMVFNLLKCTGSFFFKFSTGLPVAPRKDMHAHTCAPRRHTQPEAECLWAITKMQEARRHQEEAGGQSLETLGRKRPGFCARQSRGRGGGEGRAWGGGLETGKVDREMKEAKPPTGQTDLVWILIQASQL